MSATMLPYGRHLIEDDDILAVTAVLKGDWLTTGPSVDAFERAFARQVSAPHAIACSNGTAALHLAALALGLGPDDVVIVPTLTFLASANGPHFTGAGIVFADVDAQTGLLTSQFLLDAIERSEGRARAVVAVHLNGACCDMPAIAAIARQRGLYVIEDACHALGTTYRDGAAGHLPVGACYHSDLACFSFHPVKTIAMGEGGAVTTRDPRIAEVIRRLRSHGMIRDAGCFTGAHAFAANGQPHPWYYEMPEPGYNYRASDIQCALGMSQLRKFDRFAKRRREIAARYAERFSGWPKSVRSLPLPPGCAPVLHLYVLLIEFASTPAGTRDAAMRLLAERGIGTQVHYFPVHLQPYYRRKCGGLVLPGAHAYYESCLSIPFFPGMSDQDINRVADELEKTLIGPASACS